MLTRIGSKIRKQPARFAPGIFGGLLAVMPIAARCGPASNGPHTLSSPDSAAVMQFDTLTKAALNDGNRVDGLTFPYLQQVSNIAANEPAGGPNHCDDPDEFFGQALGYPDATQAPLMVTSGERASWSEVVAKDNSIAEAKTYTGLATCPGTSLSGLTRTIYTLNQFRPDAIKVGRVFNFKPGLGVLPSSGFRAYLPRVISAFHYVLVPNAAGNVVRYDANDCTAAPCTVTDWNGKWVADDDGLNIGLLIIRDPSDTIPAFIGIQSGGASNSNFTSIVLSQPAAGWSGTVTEIEYLCHYDTHNWSPAANTLPGGCPISTPNGH